MDVELNIPAVGGPGRATREGRTDLPRLFFIADGFASGRDGMPAGAVRERTLALVEAGVRGV